MVHVSHPHFAEGDGDPMLACLRGKGASEAQILESRPRLESPMRVVTLDQMQVCEVRDRGHVRFVPGRGTAVRVRSCARYAAVLGLRVGRNDAGVARQLEHVAPPRYLPAHAGTQPAIELEI